jgi:hypothetical protein
MDPSTSAAAQLTARDELLRGVCAKAFEYYKKGELKRGTELLQKLLARQPGHPLPHCASVRMAHMLLMEQRQPVGIQKQIDECLKLAGVAFTACPGSLLLRLLLAQVCCDDPTGEVDDALNGLRHIATAAAKQPLNVADIEYAMAIATFDEEVFTLALLPDVRECADPAAYRREALACLAKAPAMIMDLHRQTESLAKNTPEKSDLDHFLSQRDAGHAAEAARRLLRVQARVREEEAAHQPLAAVHRVMAGKGTAHDLQEAAAGWRESADQGDASAQLLIGALLARVGVAA